MELLLNKMKILANYVIQAKAVIWILKFTWMNSEHFNSGSVFRFESFRLLSSNTTTNNCSAMVRKARKVFLVAAVPMQGRGKAQFTHAAFHFTKASIYENENRGT